MVSQNVFARKIRCSYSGDCSLELDFRPKSLEIPVNQRDRQFSAALPIRDRAVSRVKLPIDFGFIPSLGVSNVSEAEIVLLGPEERNGVETFPSTQHLARRRLRLPLRNNPVFDPNSLAGEPVRPPPGL